MDFAKKQLEKYGWKEGTGLGVNGEGITKPICVKVKSDKSGVGVDPGAEFKSKWWENSFNKALNNINVEQTEDGVKVKMKKKKIKKKDLRNEMYGGFVTSGKGPKEDSSVISSVVLSDDELLKACGGLTGHKAARHGHKLSGKLARVQQQDSESGTSKEKGEDVVEPKRKKRKTK